MTPKPSRRLLRAMRRALAALPDPDCEIFARGRFEDQDYCRIALDLGTTVAGVERSLVHALRALDVAVAAAERRFWHSRTGRIFAWLRAKLPQG